MDASNAQNMLSISSEERCSAVSYNWQNRTHVLRYRLLNKLKTHLLSEANKDIERGLLRPSWWNVAASLVCVVLLVMWGGWCWHIALDKWSTGSGYFYKGAEVMADRSPIRHWLMTVGMGGLGAYSFDGALLYGIEAWMRVRRIFTKQK